MFQTLDAMLIDDFKLTVRDTRAKVHGQMVRNVRHGLRMEDAGRLLYCLGLYVNIPSRTTPSTLLAMFIG